MTLAERTLAFASQAPELQTRKALTASFMTLINEVGATKFACLFLRREQGTMVIDKSISNLPRQWQELYLARGFEAIDPVFQAVVRSGSYGYWNELISGLVLNKAGREVMAIAREFEMRDGFTKRIMLDSGGVAVVMAAGLELLRSQQARAALRVAFDVFANEGARMLKMSGEEPSSREAELTRELSKTQLRVLLMRSEGLSNKQVAQTLGRHEKTVECHVTEILRRLDARNMIDAIRIATKLKLIL
ncbi:MAG TPA: autoinducer binding domain-containing protein [Hyphomonadaceae bacterium]|jgi:DNA-binding CsgD family transcriptional regulator|nr:autoinducer binding domain-containing protein [Hyphomonadaceae bacterium]